MEMLLLVVRQQWACFGAFPNEVACDGAASYQIIG